MTATEARDLRVCVHHGTPLVWSLVQIPHCPQCWREAASVGAEREIPVRRVDRTVDYSDRRMG